MTWMSDPIWRLKNYLCWVGWLLLIQGIVSLVFLESGVGAAEATHGLISGDSVHASIHVFWGLIMVAAVLRHLAPSRLTVLGYTFGVFYSLLAVTGVIVHHPLDMELDFGQHVFHIIVGAAGLTLSILARRALRLYGTSAASALMPHVSKP
jgi:hypothetical protein